MPKFQENVSTMSIGALRDKQELILQTALHSKYSMYLNVILMPFFYRQLFVSGLWSIFF